MSSIMISAPTPFVIGGRRALTPLCLLFLLSFYSIPVSLVLACGGSVICPWDQTASPTFYADLKGVGWLHRCAAVGGSCGGHWHQRKIFTTT
jgi:hypothetical protein